MCSVLLLNEFTALCEQLDPGTLRYHHVDVAPLSHRAYVVRVTWHDVEQTRHAIEAVRQHASPKETV